MSAPAPKPATHPGWLPLPAEAGVQQLPVYGYGYQRNAQLLLEITDGAAARRWLGAVLARGWLGTEALREISGAPREAIGWALNLGLSFGGLQALGLPGRLQALLRQYAPAFSEGAVPRAARRLGDTGDNAPPHWEPAFGHRVAHLLLTLHADSLHTLDARIADLRTLDGAEGLAGWARGRSAGQHMHNDDGRRIVHFGYVDGISNPRMTGLHKPKDGQPPRHAPGELLLGHANDDGANPWRLPEAPAAAQFFRHASFGAYRKIAQDEAAFHAQAERVARELGESPEWVMAKWCGRWRDGRLMRAPGTDAAEASQSGALYNGFDFKDDPRGEGCPMGSHLRRMNPRSDPLVQNKRRPLMRRGMPYGPRWTPDAAATPSPRDDQRNAAERGLLGLFFCASLEDQFEHLLGAWADRNPLGPDHRGTAKDPLIGQHDDPNAWLEVPGAPGTPARRIRSLQPMVATRGTVYLLYLTQPALQALADGAAPSTPAATPGA
ncbi:hypothetical protein AACH10_17150 [Ideonella sp. DXS22W]|uniref:DyP dimeric alpha+beta barrel domain-containing protein n=1 Tax=Pseudaquabacterium inlustre TaxID=2984192 RepID=A0ABU9CN12_9BURK